MNLRWPASLSTAEIESSEGQPLLPMTAHLATRSDIRVDGGGVGKKSPNPKISNRTLSTELGRDARRAGLSALDTYYVPTYAVEGPRSIIATSALSLRQQLLIQSAASCLLSHYCTTVRLRCFCDRMDGYQLANRGLLGRG